MSNEARALSADDGGPAFPRQSDKDGRGEFLWAHDGMSLRDYFIAHAPNEPQPWFRPVMKPRPELMFLKAAPDSVKSELKYDDYADYVNEGDMSSAALAWHLERVSKKKETRRWDAELQKQTCLQWPAAWADEMLKARNQ